MLALLLGTSSCGALRWMFSPSDDATSPARKLLDAGEHNGADPVKWLTWIVGGGFAARGVAAGVGDAKRLAERRSGRDRRRLVVDQVGSDDQRAAGDV
jgi:hypothetical protein